MMKRICLIAITALSVGFFSCTKNVELINPASSINPANEETVLVGKGGSGSGSGGGTTATTGPISFVGGVFKMIGGNSDSIQINLTQPAPAGWVLSLTSNDPAFSVPSTYAIPQGTQYVHVPVSLAQISSAKNITITATLQGQTKSSFPFKVFPLHFNFPAPQLQSPGNGSGFKNRIQVKFTWGGNDNAYFHDIQVSDNAAFTGTPMLEVYTDDPVWAASYFNGLGFRYWRVRYVDGSGTPGPWSAVRNFEIKN